MAAQNYDIKVAQARLDWIRDRVAAYQWGDAPLLGDNEDPWAYGADLAAMRDLCTYWLDSYQWQDTQSELERFAHFTAEIDGLDIHFIRENGSGSNPQAFLMTHGWPGSVYEFVNVIDRLAHPENYGGKAEEGVTVICPSLPGYGFSGKPKRPIGPKSTAAMWDRLMRDVLGFDQYVAQGGDWGSLVTAMLGLHHGTDKGGGCKAIHISMYGARTAAQPETEAEQAWAMQMATTMQMEGAYLQLQMTKPQSLGFAMADSPVGQCAWIVEKFHGWSDNLNAQGRRELARRYTPHQLLSNVMIYLVNDNFVTSTWFYRGFLEEGADIPDGQRVEVPVGVGNFAEPYITFPPRRMVEYGYNVVHWNDFDQAGHFAAMEDGPQFVGEVQDFMRKL